MHSPQRHGKRKNQDAGMNAGPGGSGSAIEETPLQRRHWRFHFRSRARVGRSEIWQRWLTFRSPAVGLALHFVERRFDDLCRELTPVFVGQTQQMRFLAL